MYIMKDKPLPGSFFSRVFSAIACFMYRVWLIFADRNIELSTDR